MYSIQLVSVPFAFINPFMLSSYCCYPWTTVSIKIAMRLLNNILVFFIWDSHFYCIPLWINLSTVINLQIKTFEGAKANRENITFSEMFRILRYKYTPCPSYSITIFTKKLKRIENYTEKFKILWSYEMEITRRVFFMHMNNNILKSTLNSNPVYLLNRRRL